MKISGTVRVKNLKRTPKQQKFSPEKGKVREKYVEKLPEIRFVNHIEDPEQNLATSIVSGKHPVLFA